MARKDKSGKSLEFPDHVKWEALRRQGNQCAVGHGPCLGNVVGINRAHHVFPAQSFDRLPEAIRETEYRFFLSADNCVLLCENCHWRVHGGNFRDGAYAPPSYFENSHGPALGAR